MPLCNCCGGSFEAKRSDAKYCSPSCRSNSSHKRKRAEKALEKGTPKLFTMNDIKTTSLVSKQAADTLYQIAANYGHKAADMALDAVWQIAEDLGYPITAKNGVKAAK